MVPLDIQSNVTNLVEEEKWQRFNEWQERERVMRQPRATVRQRFLRASGRVFVNLGERLQQSAGPLKSELTTPC